MRQRTNSHLFCMNVYHAKYVVLGVFFLKYDFYRVFLNAKVINCYVLINHDKYQLSTR
jgi:hypothetical protein